MRFFVTGTDTGVGKTEVSCALLASMVKPWAFKPCESGGTGDSEALREAAGSWQPLESICLYRLKEPLSPLAAATRERKRIDFSKLVRGFQALGPGPGIVEGAGGLFVPITEKHDVIDLIEAVKLPVVLVARAGLGTVNHTTLSLRALAERKLKVAAVVLSQATPGSDLAISLNRDELERRFPTTTFLGPVLFEADASKRRKKLRAALKPLVRSPQ
ncbi:MAG: dethiobiotin synthase [Archangium gephyra]|uniref:ATP-dependent dethiobiotin synthetase BioD n=1 Tax=Archangium gephyra TaxID=48 RepID=A0A2W5VB46_9BACT|nr:MAG: dethiobiotin synthase [Archangium gephyra]